RRPGAVGQRRSERVLLDWRQRRHAVEGARTVRPEQLKHVPHQDSPWRRALCSGRQRYSYGQRTGQECLMAVSAARQTVGVSAVALNTASTSGIDLIIHNASANDADLGPVGVAAGSGFLLKANTTVS